MQLILKKQILANGGKGGNQCDFLKKFFYYYYSKLIYKCKKKKHKRIIKTMFNGPMNLSSELLQTVFSPLLYFTHRCKINLSISQFISEVNLNLDFTKQRWLWQLLVSPAAESGQ